ncbi:MAG: TRAP transporter small permease [Desulfovibrionaceae bacterium]|nr:TRAP transporter small permease [Desulfovibrionaceae bacterium]
MLKFLNERLEEILGSIVLAVMAVIAFLNVIVRYCTNFSFSYSEELTVNLFVWIVLLGTSRSFREGSNFCMSLFYDMMPRPARRVLYLFSLACCIAFFAALFYMGFLEVKDEIELSVVSESLAIPVWLYTICTPVLSLVIIFRILQKCAEDFRTGNY